MKSYFILLLILGHHFTYGQQNKPLGIGDTVPDFFFQRILHHPYGKARLSDFKADLTILDIWSTGCAACIEAFPKLEKLQQQFGKRLSILLVNPYTDASNSEKRITTALSRQQIRTGFYPTLPLPVNAAMVNTYFPHRSIPHTIWINKKRVIMAIASGEYLTEKNIEGMLTGDISRLPVKNDYAFDKHRPLLSDGNDQAYISRSIITPFQEGLGIRSGLRINDSGRVIGYYWINVPLSLMVTTAFNEVLNSLQKSEVFYDVTDKGRFAYKEEPDISKLYCYDVSIPPTGYNNADFYKYLREDLRRAFNIQCRTENRKVKCLVFTSNQRIIPTYTKYPQPSSDMDEESIKKYMHNMPVDEILRTISFRLSKPYIDSSGINQNIDIDFPDGFNLMDEEGILEVFRKAGFDIHEEEREMKVAVITDKI